MTHQNHQTNGASLEDCHTNFFALTELYGIKWRKLVWGETNGGGEGEEGGAPLADPVISSYARCLAGDILCVWRRVPAPAPPDPYDMTTPSPPPLSLRAAKELWIFWYGEEPDLNGLVAPELIASQGEHGSWDSGLTYECRSLLFKALHNLIERCLLSRDFVRLGKWFVQPYDGDEEDVGKSPWHLSFSFAFFLHGESTVCASVDVRQHPPVRTLSARRLQRDAPVLLAPFGLQAALTGRWWSGAACARLLDAWRALYPLEQGAGAVEVALGGARLRYPRSYVLLAELQQRPPRPDPPPPLAPRAAHALDAPDPPASASACTCTCAKWRRRRPPRPPPFHRRPAKRAALALSGGLCSPGSGAGSPAPGGSAPPSADAPPPSPPALAPALQEACLGALPTTLHTPAPTPDPLAPPTPAPAPPAPRAPPDAWRRPQLPAAPARPDPRADEHELAMLYDYSTVQAWLEHPVKRLKGAARRFREDMALGGAPQDLYAGHQHTLPAPPPPAPPITEDTKEYKNLFTSDGLCPTLKDLEQLFDNSDDAASGDETSALAGGEGGRRVRAEELSKMFPTPPSLEPHALASPQPAPDEPPPGSPPPDAPIDDWSYVFRPPPVYKYVGSSKYAALSVLPSALLPPVALPAHARYVPRARPPAPPDPPQPPQPPARPDTTNTNPNGVKRRLSPVAERAGGVCVAGLAAGEGGAGLAGGAAGCAGGARGAARRAGGAPPACALLLNVLLADTVLNIFRDHNFDSCTLCVCNVAPKVCNILGADAATYVPGDEEPPPCSCGFSAVLNRRLAHRAGLFYEDEMEITGLALPPPPGPGALGEVARDVLAACAALAGPEAGAPRAPPPLPPLNLREYEDARAAAALALQAAALSPAAPLSPAPPAPLMHRWPYIGARAPTSSKDVVRLMRRLRPLLQDAIQKRCCGARMWDGVSGPLTWRQFHRLAGRGNEDLCEPQPVPPLLVGHERDHLALAPHALRHWERLALEPYALARPVRWAALVPELSALPDAAPAFFREVGAAYEACRLGAHRPARAAPRVLRAPPAPAPARDEWAGALPPGAPGAALRGLALAARALAPALAAEGGSDALVVYVVAPAGGGAAARRALLRLSARLGAALGGALVRPVPADALWARGAARALAFSVYSGARRLLVHRPAAHSLTGFGPAARDQLMLQQKDEKNLAPYALWSPAWVLAAPIGPRGGGGGGGGGEGDAWGAGGGDEGVLFLAYCLSHDQRWLLAAATDARGELLDTQAVNVHVPRRRHPHARRLGLAKLMDWALGVMSQTAQPWRLVVGRLGRIGHGELKGWSWLLSRKHLEGASGTLRELCGACAGGAAGAVGVLSACLVSTEPDSRLRLMADRFTPDERFSQASIHSHLHTPRDVSATHILVFPTSARTQSNPMTFDQPLANGEDSDMMFLNMDMGDEDMGDEVMGADNISDIILGDMFNSMWAPASPRRAEGEGGEAAPAPAAGAGGEPVGTLLQQPLALGYLVSTAPLRDLPAWWWAGGAHLRDACPAFLKTALHLHSADDYPLGRRHAHALDSPTTTDVLRYVLEGYNALSWLALDPATHDRASCLPLHLQALVRLYHTAAAID